MPGASSTLPMSRVSASSRPSAAASSPPRSPGPPSSSGSRRRRAYTSRVPATVIVGAQWGDEGKGKIVDLLAQDSDVVCRYQGGPNAGHTIVVGDETYKIRALPSGIVRGKPCVIGNGC